MTTFVNIDFSVLKRLFSDGRKHVSMRRRKQRKHTFAYVPHIKFPFHSYVSNP